MNASNRCRTSSVTLATLCVLWLASCQLKVPENIMSASEQPTPILAGQWRLVSLPVAEGEVQLIPEDTTMTLTFEGGRLHGQSSCNRYSGSYTRQSAEEGPLAIEIGSIMATRMACPPKDMQLEALLFKQLRGLHVLTVGDTDDQLVLTGENGLELRWHRADPE